MKEQKKSSTTQELEMGGVSAIAKQRKVFGDPHKELKSRASRVKSRLWLGSRTMPTPDVVNLIAKSTMLSPKITLTVIHYSQNI